MGKSHLLRSLKTRDIVEARKRRWPVLAELKASLEYARTLKEKPGSPDALLVEARDIREEYVSLEEAGDDQRATGISFVVTDRAEGIEEKHGYKVARAYVDIALNQDQPLSDQVDAWLGEQNVTKKTELLYRAAINSFIDWSAGEVFVSAVTRKEAGRYVSQYLLKTGRSASTNNRDITALSSLWKWMVVRGITEGNPWKDQKIPKGSHRGSVEKDKRLPFTDTELSSLLELAPTFGRPTSSTLYDIISIGALSGMRLEEICSLRVADCEQGLFSIKEGKTKSSVREVPIHSQLKGIVRTRSQRKKANGYLFHELSPSGPDQRMSESVSKRLSRLVRREAGISDKRKTFHSLRHRFVTNALQAGHDPWVVKDVVGHSQSGVTLSIYSQGASIEQKRSCIESVQLPHQY